MKKTLLIIGSVVLGLVVLLAAIVVIALVRLDANDYKPTITAAFEGATGRKLHLDGNLELKLYPWLALSIDNLSIDNAPGFGAEPLVSIEHAEARIKLLPLLHDEYEIDTVKISGVRSNLAIDDKGNNNWTLTPVNQEPADETQTSQTPIKKLVIGGITIHDTLLHFEDMRSKAQYELDKLNVSMGELQYGKPIALSATFRASSRQPDLSADVNFDGTALYDDDSGIYQVEPLNMEAILSGATVPDGKMAVKLQSSIKYDNNTKSLSLPNLLISALDARISSKVTVEQVEGVAVTQADIDIKGSDLGQLFRIIGQDALAARIRELDGKFTVNATVKQQRGALTVPQLKAALLGATIDGTLTSPDGSALQGKLLAQGPDLPTLIETVGFLQGGSNSPLAKQGKMLNGLRDKHFAVKAGFSGNQTRKVLEVTGLEVDALGLAMTGTVTAQDYATKPVIEGKLKVPAFNLRDLLQQLQPNLLHTQDANVLKRVALDAEFAASANALNLKQMTLKVDETTIKGKTDISDLANLVARFEVDIDTLNVDRYLAPTEKTASATKAETPPQPLPLDDLRKLNLHGAFKVGQLIFNGLHLSQIQVPLDAEKGLLLLSPMQAALYGGTFNGKVALDVTGEEAVSSVNTTVQRVDLGPLQQDLVHASYVAGKANIDLELQGRGNDSVALRSKLNGKGKLDLADGVLSGIDIGNTLTTVETILRTRNVRELPKGGDTRFSNFAATLQISNGVVHSDDLLIKAPGWQVSGEGTLIDIGKETLDFDLVATVDATTATVDGKQYNIGGHELPITCGGKVVAPACKPDVGAILSVALQGVKDSLKDMLGIGRKNEPATNKDGAQPAEQPQQAAPKKADEVINLLNKALKR